MEAYKVSTTLELKDLVGARLATLIEDMDLLEKSTVRARRRLREFGAETSGIRNAGRAVRAMQKDMDLAERNIGRMGTAFKSFNASSMTGGIKGIHGELQRATAASTAFNAELLGIGVAIPEMRTAVKIIRRMETGLAGASRNASMLVAQLHGVANAMRGMPAGPSIPRIGRGGFGVGGAGHAGGIHGGNVHVGSHGVGVGSLGFGVGALGGGALIAGYAGVHEVISAAQHAGDFSREQAQFSMFGMSDAQNATAKKIAQTMNVPGTSMIDAMKYVTEAQGIFRESGFEGDKALDAAREVAPVLAKLHYASGLLGKEFSDSQALDFTRSVEMMGGLSSPKRMQELADSAFKLMITSGGAVDPSQLRQAIRTGGTSVKGLSGEALFGYAEPLMGELKGGSFGTAMATAYSRVNGLVKLPNQALHEMMRLGLWDKNAIVLNKNGGLDHVKEGKNPLFNSGEYATNPFEFYDKHVKSQYDKMGFDEQQRQRENVLLFGRTGGNLFNLVDQQMEKLRDSAKAMKIAAPLQKGVDEENKQLSGQMKNFEAAWSDFQTVFGETILPQVTEMIKGATSLLKLATGVAAGVGDRDAKLTGQINGPSASDTPGKWGALGDLWRNHFGGDKDEASSGAAPNPVAAPSARPIDLHTHFSMDGRSVADIVTRHQADNISANKGVGPYDIGLGMPSFGMK
jgi:hypothetical protein